MSYTKFDKLSDEWLMLMKERDALEMSHEHDGAREAEIATRLGEIKQQTASIKDAYSKGVEP